MHNPLSWLVCSTFRQLATVFVSCIPTTAVSTQQRRGSSQAGRILGGNLRLQHADVNHLDYRDYKPPPPTPRNLLTWIWLKVPVAVGDLSSCSAPSMATPATPLLKTPPPSQAQLVPEVILGLFHPIAKEVVTKKFTRNTHTETHKFSVYVSLLASFLIFIKNWQWVKSSLLLCGQQACRCF